MTVRTIGRTAEEVDRMAEVEAEVEAAGPEGGREG